eukprot:TRINITY_DN3994_c0_g1_i2.p1 TRINITY_DN3994_c0_g1~~TRINITY_DN3994_c0_g1_i2.p1  ORF type:complete len:1470 (+),score=528.61 TRINITY_DN3994_c0_g1_i2:81-4490(+)
MGNCVSREDLDEAEMRALKAEEMTKFLETQVEDLQRAGYLSARRCQQSERAARALQARLFALQEAGTPVPAAIIEAVKAAAEKHTQVGDELSQAVSSETTDTVMELPSKTILEKLHDRKGRVPRFMEAVKSDGSDRYEVAAIRSKDTANFGGKSVDAYANECQIMHHYSEHVGWRTFEALGTEDGDNQGEKVFHKFSERSYKKIFDAEQRAAALFEEVSDLRDAQKSAREAEARVGELEQEVEALKDGQLTARTAERRADALEDEVEGMRMENQMATQAWEKRAQELEAQVEQLKKDGEVREHEWHSKLACKVFKANVKQVKVQHDVEKLEDKLHHADESIVKAVEAAEPIQKCMVDGDAHALKETIDQLSKVMEMGEAEQQKVYGHFARVIVPFYEAAVAKNKCWQEILNTIRGLIKTMGDHITLRQAKKLFDQLRDAVMIGLDIEKTDPDLIQEICGLLFHYFVQEGAVGNTLQAEIIRRVAKCKAFREFDFTDLSRCIAFADKEDTPENQFFLQRARALLEANEVTEFKNAISNMDTILYFLRYLDREDLALTYKQYQKLQTGTWITKYIEAAKRQYGPGQELVRTTGKDLLSEQDVQDILHQLKEASDHSVGTKTIDGLKSIFFWWAQIMKEKFDLLVLPHQTQVVCLLICLEFIRGQHDGGAALPDAGALIAEIGTGEGKSAVIAMMALYCVTVLKKQVHVCVDDETLVERDFVSLRSLFHKFQDRDGRPVSAQLCVSARRKETHFKYDDSIVTQVSEDCDIVYCEAKHIQSFYTRLAKKGGTDFDKVFKDRILILDEVDALVIDEAPNVPFTYENPELSTFATKVADAIQQSKSSSDLMGMASTPAERRVVRSMENAAKTAAKWELHADYAFDEQAAQYFRVEKGRVNEGAYSLALELKNYVDNFTDHVIYNERLFIMSRPRTFRKYERIVGLSGSVGSHVEREFLQTIYKAEFVKVPKFLTTCRDAVANTPVPQGVHITKNEEEQLAKTCQEAFLNRKKVPVLLIAADRRRASILLEKLQSMAEKAGYRGWDIVRSLSRDLYESNPGQFKENLFQCTQATGKGSAKSFRIAVTDPRGGRGMDYRVTDQDADRNGGLLMVVQRVPKHSRDWIQYLGRTARQDCKGQWMAVLNMEDYRTDMQKFNQSLKSEGAVEQILKWGEHEEKDRIQSTHDDYHRGVRMNELCEEVSERNLLGNNERARTAMVYLCNAYTHMSLRQIDDAASKIEGLDPREVVTEADEVEADGNATPRLGAPFGQGDAAPRSIVVLLDRSSSMDSKDAGRRSRFEVCRDCIMMIFKDHVDAQDMVGLYSFEDKVRESFPLTQKGPNEEKLSSKIKNLPAPHGLTRFYDGVLECVEKLQQSSNGHKFLIALTDGDDNMSNEQPQGQKVVEVLKKGVPGLTLIIITCGTKIQPRTIEVLHQWTSIVQSSGGTAMHIPANRPTQLVDAFARVAEAIDAEGEREI